MQRLQVITSCESLRHPQISPAASHSQEIRKSYKQPIQLACSHTCNPGTFRVGGPRRSELETSLDQHGGDTLLSLKIQMLAVCGMPVIPTYWRLSRRIYLNSRKEGGGVFVVSRDLLHSSLGNKSETGAPKQTNKTKLTTAPLTALKLLRGAKCRDPNPQNGP